jgi:RNA polymerase sigma-70 factor (ECF subfamily)
MTTSDEDLARAAIQGDGDSLKQLIERYNRQAIVLAYQLVGEWEDARDIAQDGFLKLLTRISGFKGYSSFKTWFFRIIINQSLDVRRKRRRSLRPLSGTDPEDLAGPDSWDGEVEKREALMGLETALDELSPNQRAALMLRHYEGLSMKEVAEVLNCAETTARGHVFRALKRVRQKLTAADKEPHGRGTGGDIRGVGA